MVVRFVVDWSVKQHLVHLEFLQKNMKVKVLAREVISMLSVMLGIWSNMLLSVMHDQVTVNTAVMSIMSVVYLHIEHWLHVSCT